MLNITLNLRYAVDGRARGVHDRRNGGCPAVVRDRCDKAVFAMIISSFSRSSSISVSRRASAFQRYAIRCGACDCRALRNSSEDIADDQHDRE